MRYIVALVFCLICIHSHEMWANGSVHHNNNTTNNNTTNNQGGQGGNGVGIGVGVGHGGDARSSSTAVSGASNSLDQDYEAAASSAAVYLSGCQQGVAAQGVGFGASTGGESRVCQILRLAAAHAALGQPYEAMRLVRQATEEMNGGGYTPQEAPPLAKASRWFRRNLVAPLFSWLPFVGHSV